MFIDMHAHTGKISICCQAGRDEILKTAKEVGFDAVVITNHYTAPYFTEDSHKAWIEKYIKEWDLCRKAGENIGIKVFCGIEVTFEKDFKVHFLIYGADEAFLRNNLFLCYKTQEELFRLCEENGCVLVQAHPFRNGSSVMDTSLLHGIEINCHPKYKNSYAEDLIKIAAENNLLLTVGCDYHADTYRPLGGMFLPDSIKTDKELADFIKLKNPTKLQIQEPLDKSIYEKEF